MVFLSRPVYSLIQINAYILTTLTFIMYVKNCKPFKDKDLLQIEVINETFLLLTSYTLFYYSDYNNQEGFSEFKYNVGWIMIGLIVTLIGFNMFVIVRETIL